MSPSSNGPTSSINQFEELVPNFCDKCGNKFVKTDMEVISNEGGKAVCRVGCKICGHSFLMHVANPMPGVVSSVKTPFKSSLTTSEIKKFAKSKKIDPEEELDVYISLKAVKTINDFNDLFKINQA